MYDNIFQKCPAFFFMLSVMPDIAPFSKHLVATNFSFLEQKQSGEKKKRHKQRNNTKLSPKTRSNHRVDPVCQNCLLEAAEPRGWQYKVGKNDALQKTTNIASEIKNEPAKLQTWNGTGELVNKTET